MKTIPGKPDQLDITSQWAQNFYKVLGRTTLVPSTGRYNMTVSHEKKFIWFRVAKVGTRTIFNHLKDCGVRLDVEHASFLHYRTRAYEGYFRFGFVRNPWDRLVSCWQNKVIDANFFHFPDEQWERMKTFENFVDYVATLDISHCDRHIRAQSALIDLNSVDFVGRMESFDDDVNYVFERLGLPEKEIKAHNVTSNREAYQAYYNDKLIEKVTAIYRKDIQIFGYRW